jgi:hypothetical protein
MPVRIILFTLLILAWTVLCFLSRYIVGDLIALTALVLGEIVWFGIAFVKFCCLTESED